MQSGKENKPSRFEIEFVDGKEQYTYGFEVSKKESNRSG